MASDPSRKTPLQRLAARLRAFPGDRSGATAVEFGFVAILLVTSLLAILQFSMVFLSQMNMHHAVSDAATGSNTQTIAGNRTDVAIQICRRLVLVDNCTTNLRLESQPLASYSGTAQAIAGTNFMPGAVGTAMLIRARAPIVTFVPGLPTLWVSGSALYMRRS